MIKSNELRTGNYVLDTSGKKETKVESLSKASVNGLPESQFEPVHLTLSILENCGFERGTKPGELPSGPYKKGLVQVKVGNEHYDPIFSQENGTKLPHVHQLQNLYFALSGEELDVKL